MPGLQKILKIHGEMKVQDEKSTVIWVWDYKNNCPRKKSEMTAKEYKENKRLHSTKGVLQSIGMDKVEYGSTPTT